MGRDGVVGLVGLVDVGTGVGLGGREPPRTHSAFSQEYPAGHFEQAFPTSYIVEPLQLPPLA